MEQLYAIWIYDMLGSFHRSVNTSVIETRSIKLYDERNVPLIDSCEGLGWLQRTRSGSKPVDG